MNLAALIYAVDVGGGAVSYGQDARHYPYGPLVFLRGSARTKATFKLVLVMNPGLNCSCQPYIADVVRSSCEDIRHDYVPGTWKIRDTTYQVLVLHAEEK